MKVKTLTPPVWDGLREFQLRVSIYRWEAIAKRCCEAQIAREEVVAIDEFRLEEQTQPEARGRAYVD
jgi:hypothetical protein